jgi:hypothetical protein
MIADIIVDGCVISFWIYLFSRSWYAIIPGFLVAVILEYYRQKREYEEALEWDL